MLRRGKKRLRTQQHEKRQSAKRPAANEFGVIKQV